MAPSRFDMEKGEMLKENHWISRQTGVGRVVATPLKVSGTILAGPNLIFILMNLLISTKPTRVQDGAVKMADLLYKLLNYGLW